MDKIKVLIIDDEKGTRDMLSHELQADGYMVTSAEDGYKALEEIKETPCDIALVDLKLPGLDGIGVLQKIKEHNPETEVIIITGYSSLESAIEAVNKGAFAYIQKPLNMDDVFATLRKAVEKQRLVLENKKLLVELKKAYETLEQQSDKMSSLGLMAGGVAHELNNPLTAILGTADILLYGLPANNPLRNDLQDIKNSALSCKEIITGLLGFARQQEFRIQLAEIHPVIERALALCHYELEKHQIKVVKVYDKNLTSIEMSPSHIQQVFLNIILNAVDVMPAGGTLTITTKSVHSPKSEVQSQLTSDIGHRTSDYIEISFSDTGKGIPEENLSKIFDPFFTTKEPGKGTGLGLSVVYGIVKNHKGEIIAESEGLGNGATFRIILPITQMGI